MTFGAKVHVCMCYDRHKVRSHYQILYILVSHIYQPLMALISPLSSRGLCPVMNLNESQNDPIAQHPLFPPRTVEASPRFSDYPPAPRRPLLFEQIVSETCRPRCESTNQVCKLSWSGILDVLIDRVSPPPIDEPSDFVRDGTTSLPLELTKSLHLNYLSKVVSSHYMTTSAST